MSGTNAQVLVVDDEWMIRQQLSRALASVGVRCDCAIDGDDALDRFIHHRYDLIVTDLRMPERHGHSLAVTLLGQPDPPIVVALTGVTEPRLASDLLARGVANVVFKPINYFDLADQLKGLLESSPSRRETAETQVTVMQSTDLTEIPAQYDDPSHRTRRELEQLLVKSLPTHRWMTTALQWIDWERLPNPPVEIRETLRLLASHPSHMPPDCRREGRAILNEKAVAMALNDSFEPIGQPFKVIVRDLSYHGIGIVHTGQIDSALIAISWRGLRRNRIIVAARVLRCRQVGAFFDIGAMIVRLSDSPSASIL